MLQETLLSAQIAHIKRALRIFGAPIEVAPALGVSIQQVEAVSNESRAPLFHPLSRSRAGTFDPTDWRILAALGVLFVVGDPVLRAAAQLGIASRDMRATVAVDTLGALAHLAAQPGGFAVVVGADALFSFEETVAQVRRVSPQLRLAVLADDLPAGLSVEPAGTLVHDMPALKDSFTRLLLC